MPPMAPILRGIFWDVRKKDPDDYFGAEVDNTDGHLENGYGSGTSNDGQNVIIWYVLREHHRPRAATEESKTLPYHFMHFSIVPRDFLSATPENLYATHPPSP